MRCREHLRDAQGRAQADQEVARSRFREFVEARVPAAQHMNVGSGAQVRQLLFAGVPNQRPDKGELELERSFKVREALAQTKTY